MFTKHNAVGNRLNEAVGFLTASYFFFSVKEEVSKKKRFRDCISGTISIFDARMLSRLTAINESGQTQQVLFIFKKEQIRKKNFGEYMIKLK